MEKGTYVQWSAIRGTRVSRVSPKFWVLQLAALACFFLLRTATVSYVTYNLDQGERNYLSLFTTNAVNCFLFAFYSKVWSSKLFLYFFPFLSDYIPLRDPSGSWLSFSAFVCHFLNFYSKMLLILCIFQCKLYYVHLFWQLSQFN